MGERRQRKVVAAVAVVIVGLIATALALGGGSGSSDSGSGSAGGASSAGLAQSGVGASGGLAYGKASTTHAQSVPARAAAAGSVASSSASAVAGAPASANVAESISDGVTATRVVKTGNLDLRVARNQVQPTLAKLVDLTNSLHGYVSKSSTSSELGSPEGNVTLRIPAAGFDTAVNDAEKLGHVDSLTTNATDVTGKFVDLGARLTALKRTRTTYLTILSQARSIGATLSVQQRVDDVQQQIEELQGQLKVLANQSADGTLAVDVTAPGAVVQPPKQRHHRSGLSAAWHRSISRFERGGDAIIGALGPLLLALLIVAALAGVGLLGYRGMRRLSGSSSAG